MNTGGSDIFRSDAIDKNSSKLTYGWDTPFNKPLEELNNSSFAKSTIIHEGSGSHVMTTSYKNSTISVSLASSQLDDLSSTYSDKTLPDDGYSSEFTYGLWTPFNKPLDEGTSVEPILNVEVSGSHITTVFGKDNALPVIMESCPPGDVSSTHSNVELPADISSCEFSYGLWTPFNKPLEEGTSVEHVVNTEVSGSHIATIFDKDNALPVITESCPLGDLSSTHSNVELPADVSSCEFTYGLWTPFNKPLEEGTSVEHVVNTEVSGSHIATIFDKDNALPVITESCPLGDLSSTHSNVELPADVSSCEFTYGLWTPFNKPLEEVQSESCVELTADLEMSSPRMLVDGSENDPVSVSVVSHQRDDSSSTHIDELSNCSSQLTYGLWTPYNKPLEDVTSVEQAMIGMSGSSNNVATHTSVVPSQLDDFSSIHSDAELISGGSSCLAVTLASQLDDVSSTNSGNILPEELTSCELTYGWYTPFNKPVPSFLKRLEGVPVELQQIFLSECTVQSLYSLVLVSSSLREAALEIVKKRRLDIKVQQSDRFNDYTDSQHPILTRMTVTDLDDPFRDDRYTFDCGQHKSRCHCKLDVFGMLLFCLHAEINTIDITNYPYFSPFVLVQTKMDAEQRGITLNIPNEKIVVEKIVATRDECFDLLNVLSPRMFHVFIKKAVFDPDNVYSFFCCPEVRSAEAICVKQEDNWKEAGIFRCDEYFLKLSASRIDYQGVSCGMLEWTAQGLSRFIEQWVLGHRSIDEIHTNGRLDGSLTAYFPRLHRLLELLQPNTQVDLLPASERITPWNMRYHQYYGLHGWRTFSLWDCLRVTRHDGQQIAMFVSTDCGFNIDIFRLK